MVSTLMEFTNYLAEVKEAGRIIAPAWQAAVINLVLLLAPSTPHLAEELWHQIGREYSVHNQSWPQWDEELAQDEEVTLVVQVNGKLRDRITVSASITEAEAKEKAMASEKVRTYLEGKTTVKEIYVPGKLLNIVVR